MVQRFWSAVSKCTTRLTSSSLVGHHRSFLCENCPKLGTNISPYVQTTHAAFNVTDTTSISTPAASFFRHTSRMGNTNPNPTLNQSDLVTELRDSAQKMSFWISLSDSSNICLLDLCTAESPRKQTSTSAGYVSQMKSLVRSRWRLNLRVMDLVQRGRDNSPASYKSQLVTNV